jgi:hypothetical protein
MESEEHTLFVGAVLFVAQNNALAPPKEQAKIS